MKKDKKELKVNTLNLYNEAFDGDVSKDRQTFIGGSDVGTIMGVNPFKSAFDLYLEKTEHIERENIDDKLQIRLGHKMENVVAEIYEEETGDKVQLSNRSYRCKEYPFLIGHIDRKVVGKKKGLEIKTTSSFNKTEYDDGEIPPTHYFQCMFYMMITGFHDWDLATLRDNRNFYVTHVTWDEHIAELMLDRILKFWECVEKKEWTLGLDGSESTKKALDKAYPATNTNNELQILKENQIAMPIQNYEEAKKTLKELNELVDSFENEIKSIMGKSECAVLDDKYRIDWKTFKRAGGYDVKKFLEEHPKSELVKYKKPDTTYRRFSIKEIKQKDVKRLENRNR